MLVWSENELTAAAIFLGFIDIEDITKWYELFGGIPWYFLLCGNQTSIV